MNPSGETTCYDLIVVGGGAAGFFAAIQAMETNGNLKILILERSSKLLSKVRVSGGGRCNVTHHCFDPVQLAHHYPRGGKTLKTLFKIYQAEDVVRWFQAKGVALKTEADGRMFPVTNSSQTIIDCFLREAEKYGIYIFTNSEVIQTERETDGMFKVHIHKGDAYSTKKILVATGGSPNHVAYEWIARLGHRIVPPVPSLFTFNDPEKKFAGLMGLTVPHAEVKIAGTKFSQQGPVLITHWGLSGPAVIRLSAWAAIYLQQVNYQFTALVSWIGPEKEETLREKLSMYKETHKKQKVNSNPLFNLPQRLWQRLCELALIEENIIWGELPKRNLNKLMEFLIRCPFSIHGKTTFKEEFVTCGGIDLSEIDFERMESKIVKNLFFAGEVLNIDGETGGFNFQAAWNTGYIAARAVAI